MKLLLALAVSTVFVPVTMPDAGSCEVEDALACVVLAPEDGAVRVAAAVPATYVIESADGTPLARGSAEGAIVDLPPGAARLVVRAA